MPSNPEMDLTRATGDALVAFCFKSGLPRDESVATMRDTILRQARAQWEQERGTPLTDSEIAGMIREAFSTHHRRMVPDEQVIAANPDRVRIARAAYARGQSPAPDVRALQREAWDACVNFGHRESLAWGRKRYDAEQGFTPAKSACVFCPYTNVERWRELAAKGGEDWALAVRVDEAIRVNPKWEQRQFLNRRLLPIVDLVRQPLPAADEPNLFENECEGVCAI